MIQLKGITWDHPRGYDPLAASQAEAETRWGLKVLWEKRSLQEFGDTPLEELAEQFDLLVIDHPHIATAASSACLLPLDPLLPAETLSALAEQSAGPSFASYVYAGQSWALPVDAACQVGCYHPRRLSAAQLPKDWSACMELASGLQDQGKWMAMALCPTDALCSFLSLCAQFGSPPEVAKARFVDVGVGLEVLDLLQNLVAHAHPDSLNWNPIQVLDAMSQAESNLAYMPLAFGYSNYSRPGFRPERLQFCGIPGAHSALLGGAGLALSRQCRAPREAAAYVSWLCSEIYQCGTYTAQGGQPGNALAWQRCSTDQFTGGFLSATRDTLRHAYTRPRCPGWPAFQTELGLRIHAFLTKQTSRPELLLQELQQRYEQEVLSRNTEFDHEPV